MSEATPMASEPPTPSAEQLADWQRLVERIRQGDRAQVVAWDEGAAAGTATYQVLVTQGVRQRLRGWHRRRPTGGSHRAQHDLSPAAPRRWGLDGGLWRR